MGRIVQHFRLRRFSVRLLILLLGLLSAALAANYLFVSHANLSNALAHSRDNLQIGAHVYDESVRLQIDYLARAARTMTGDYAIRQVLQQQQPDTNTLSSALQNYTQRIGAPVIALIDTDGHLIANSDPAMANENLEPFRHLIWHAAENDLRYASDFSYLRDELHVLVVVPLYAPEPEIVAWFGLAFPMDQKFAAKIKATTGIDVSFVATAPPRLLATTLPGANHAPVVAAVARQRPSDDRLKTIALADDDYVTLFKPQDLLGEDRIQIVLQRPLSTELAAARDLQNKLVLISLAALAVAVLAAFWIARGVSQPVLALAAHTRHVAAGDYTRRLDLRRADELGQLATAFNDMTAGLAERDRVRDLLDKNVSPEVAAQLLRDGAALGGEEREVTILFADLRGFTTLSEKLPPRELLALLNRYLDRMSAAIEAHGGVIDKFIGDAIMALFGAPLAQSDAPARALAAALAMESALLALNAELAAESGFPPSASGSQLSALSSRLSFGIGVNTARVIAGNIGSHRRLNYSVIGDGVNVAARLQSLTRDPVHHTNIITSAATLASFHATPTAISELRSPSFRPLGSVAVKGRTEPVEIFAVS